MRYRGAILFTGIAAVALWLGKNHFVTPTLVQPALRDVSLASAGERQQSSSRSLTTRAWLGEAANDPFSFAATRAPAQRSAPRAPKLAPPPVQPPPPAPPSAPPFPYRVFGELRDPAGKRVVYLMKDDKLVAITANTELESGYHIESVSDSQVVVRHALLSQPMTLQLPKDPK